MNINEITMLHYVENTLSADDRRLFEQLMEQDPELREHVNAMQASKLPYQAAFTNESIPSMPDSLKNQIQQLGHIADTVADTHEPVTRSAANDGRRIRYAWVASFVFVAFLTGLLANPLLQRAMDTNTAHTEMAALGTSEDLLQAMIQYQALYTAKTIENIQQNDARTQQVVSDFFADSTLDGYQPPDLLQNGYTFKRAQLLAHEGEAILQLVYAGSDGEPLALCVTRNTNLATSDFTAMTYPFAGINSKVWSYNNFVFMLMQDTDATQLDKVYQSLRS